MRGGFRLTTALKMIEGTVTPQIYPKVLMKLYDAAVDATSNSGSAAMNAGNSTDMIITAPALAISSKKTQATVTVS